MAQLLPLAIAGVTCFEQPFSRSCWWWAWVRTPCFCARHGATPSRPRAPAAIKRTPVLLQAWRAVTTAGLRRSAAPSSSGRTYGASRLTMARAMRLSFLNVRCRYRQTSCVWVLIPDDRRRYKLDLSFAPSES